jgi:hypothetical protein
VAWKRSDENGSGKNMADIFERLNYLLHSPKITDNEAMDLLWLLRRDERNNERFDITASDRDNRRRRMDIAREILNEESTFSLDTIAEIIWPNSTAHEFSEVPDREHAQQTESVSNWMENFGKTPPVASDPTQVPTPIHCAKLGPEAGPLGYCESERVQGALYCVRHLSSHPPYDPNNAGPG